jgi:hypothetical protein
MKNVICNAANITNEWGIGESGKSDERDRKNPSPSDKSG